MNLESQSYSSFSLSKNVLCIHKHELQVYSPKEIEKLKKENAISSWNIKLSNIKHFVDEWIKKEQLQCQNDEKKDTKILKENITLINKKIETSNDNLRSSLKGKFLAVFGLRELFEIRTINLDSLDKIKLLMDNRSKEEIDRQFSWQVGNFTILLKANYGVEDDIWNQFLETKEIEKWLIHKNNNKDSSKMECLYFSIPHQQPNKRELTLLIPTEEQEKSSKFYFKHLWEIKNVGIDDPEKAEIPYAFQSSKFEVISKAKLTSEKEYLKFKFYESQSKEQWIEMTLSKTKWE